MKFAVIILIFCCYFEIVNSLVIYRRKPKPKLICKEESEWLAQSNGKIDNILTNGTIFELTNSDSHDSSSESREQVRLRPRLRRSINQTPIDTSSNTEPVIIIDDSNDNDFEIIGDLTKAEKRILQRKLAATCNALSLD